MIVVDTNVISEVMKASPSTRILDWWQRYPVSELFVTTITEAEIRLGIDLLPSGKRRMALSAAAETMFDDQFEGRVLPFDRDAAEEFAKIVAGRRRIGRPISQMDAQIAAIARSRGAAIATRNDGDFEGCGVRVSNPWRDS